MNVFLHKVGGFIQRAWFYWPRGFRWGMGIALIVTFLFGVLGSAGVIPESVVIWR